MTRFALIKTTPLLLGMLALTGCPDDPLTPIDEGTSTAGDDSGSTTNQPPVTTIEPDSGSESGPGPVTGDDSTTAADPCDGVECPEGEECIAGSCFMCGMPTCESECAEGETCHCPAGEICCDVGECAAPVCPLPAVPGNFGDCLEDDGTTNDAVCDGAGCVSDSAVTGAVCLPTGCEASCQCPAAPAGSEAPVVCDDATNDGTNDCYLSCDGGEACPDGMVCFGGYICLFSNTAPVEVPTYGDCFNVAGAMCAAGQCVQAPTAGVCVEPCADAADCPAAPATGNAVVTCGNITQPDMNPECYLDCQGGATCPDGMVCFGGFACLWPEVAPPGDSYGDCINPPGLCQPGEDACVDDGAAMPTAGACSQSGCADATDCPDAPATGDAVVSCGDLGDGNTCYLDCGMGEACPDGMACTVVDDGMGGSSSACLWPFVPADYTCSDLDLGSAVGAAVAMGTTAGGGNDFNPACSAGDEEDVELQWTAPAAGSYTFDTVGSSFDTILTVRTHCAGVDLGCNDDTMMLLSEVTVDLAAGQSVVIVIDGYNETGNYVLNIN